MEKFEFTADPHTFDRKPSKEEAARINNSLRPADVNSIEDIEQGISWSPSVFDGTRSNSNWIGQCILAMDFDGGITPTEAIDRMQAYDITPSAWYPTFGDSPEKRKFRLVFFLDTLITNRQARNHLMDSLLAFYPEADRACRDEAHYFYGTNKKGEVLNDKAIYLDLLITVLDAHKVKGGGRLRKLKVGEEGNRKLRAFGNNRSSYTNYIGGTEITMTFEEKKEAIEELRRNLDAKEINWDKLQDRVSIFYDFMNSDKRLKYAQLLGIAQNLAWMKGGKKIYERRLREFNNNHEGNDPYPENDGRFELIRTMRAYNRTIEGAYFPQRLENFSPYREDHKYRNLIQAERDMISGIEQTEPITRIPLDKAEQLLQYKLDRAMDSLDDKIYIFRLVTGIGKSWRIKDLDDVTLAFPTNDLKKEMFGSREQPNSAVMTPELPTFGHDLLNRKLKRLYATGLGKQAHRLLWDLKNGHVGYSKDQQLAANYMDANKAAKNSIQTVFTTHERALHTSYGADTIVFDEDPVELLLNVDTLKIADLKKIEKRANMFGNKHLDILDLQRYLEEVQEDRILELPGKFEVDLSKHWASVINARGIDSNIMEFLDCEYFYKDPNDRDKIHFVNRHTLPEDKKIIIMSATVPIFIYKKLFGERVEVIDISDVQHKGQITLHHEYSYSRNSLASRLKEANEKTRDRPTITFKSFNDSIETASDQMHFGNCSGYNGYTGVDLNVLGTPHKHNSQYILIGKALGGNVDQFNREFGMRTVRRGGFTFSFNTFANKDLREIQLSLIEIELIQAAGRARALREDVKVDIYSNLPLRIATDFKPEIRQMYPVESEEC